jgi:pimeloyl-ACP methyl ester carboxylesterase
LITESAQAFVEDRTIEGLEDARELFKDPGQVDRLKRYHGEKARWVLDAWIESWLAPAFATWSLRPVLPQVACPTLVIHGIDDEYGSSAHPALIAELSGGPARLELMADTRHVPHREREAEVIAMVKAFVSALP